MTILLVTDLEAFFLIPILILPIAVVIVGIKFSSTRIVAGLILVAIGASGLVIGYGMATSGAILWIALGVGFLLIGLRARLRRSARFGPRGFSGADD